MALKVLLFGRLADLAGWRETCLEDPPETVNEVIGQLALDHPALAEALRAKTTRLALDKTMIGRDIAIPRQGELAFLPPLSGG